MTAEAQTVKAAGSLRRRLLLGAAVWITLALLASGLLIAWLLTGAVERQVEQRLEAEVDRLVAAIAIMPEGAVELDPRPAAPEFAKPYSGHYWQISREGQVLLRSRSLWDGVLALDADAAAPADGALHRHRGTGPDGEPVTVIERNVVPVGLDAPLRVAVALNRSAVTEITLPAVITLAVSLSVLALGLMAAAWLQVSAGLDPLQRLRRAVAGVAGGDTDALGGGWPQEVAPLAAELDLVLSSNRRMIETARRQAGDLAHALKTRLAVAANEADGLMATAPEQAGRLAEELTAARRLLDRHLARVRSGGGAPGLRRRVPAAEVVGRVADVVLRLSDRPLDMERDFDENARFLGDRADLEEIAGNLLDNAAKWARGRVRISLATRPGRLELRVEDDGPGIPDAERTRVLHPGVRLDERADGSGLGLAIVGELTAAYGGTLELDASTWGGLSVAVGLPGG